ncbi:TPA_asm: putative inclusion body protein [Bacopa monnieri virus 3]|nr:TPA_asm: putative inclusion body protein [Bacopa monnieri virus 3]
MILPLNYLNLLIISMQINFQDQLNALTALVEKLSAENAKLQEKLMEAYNVQDRIIVPDKIMVETKATGLAKVNIPEKETPEKTDNTGLTKVNYAEPSRPDYSAIGRVNHFRGRGGRGIFQNINDRKLKGKEIMETNELSYANKVKSQKKDFDFKVTRYVNNFYKITTFLNNNTENKEKSFSVVTHEKINLLIALPGCNSNLIKTCYEYGLLYSVYTKDGSEVIHIPDLYRVIQGYLKITKAQLIFVRIYSTTGEVTFDTIIPPIRFIKIGITQHYIISENPMKLPPLEINQIPSYLQNKRAWSLKIIVSAIKELLKSPFWVNFYERNTVICTFASSFKGQDTMENMIKGILQPEIQFTRVISQGSITEEVMKKLCKMFKSEEEHFCKYCLQQDNDVPNEYDYFSQVYIFIPNESYHSILPSKQ